MRKRQGILPHDAFDTMRDCLQHTFQILTKRSARLRKLADEFDWPANVWMGVSVAKAMKRR